MLYLRPSSEVDRVKPALNLAIAGGISFMTVSAAVFSAYLTLTWLSLAYVCELKSRGASQSSH